MPEQSPADTAPPEPDRFFRWPSPKALVFWLGLLGTVAIVGSAVGGAFFVEKKIYEVDRTAQAAVNAKVDTAVTTVTVEVKALQRQVEAGIVDAKEERKEQRQDMKELKESVGTLLRRSR
jgi:D-tyrosyl-tRNA(Tyr) deacylase